MARDEYRRARSCAHRMTEIRHFDALSHYLLGNIDEALGNLPEARRWLQKAIYLDQEFIAAYLDLAALYSVEKNREKARQSSRSAMSLLQSMPADTPIGPYGELSAGELLAELKSTERGADQV